MPVIKTERHAEARAFYEGFLGFRVAMDEDGMLMLASTSTPTTQVIVVWPSATAVDPELLAVDVSIEVADVDTAHETARSEGLRSFASCATSLGASGGSSSATRRGARSTSPATCEALSRVPLAIAFRSISRMALDLAGGYAIPITLSPATVRSRMPISEPVTASDARRIASAWPKCSSINGWSRVSHSPSLVPRLPTAK